MATLQAQYESIRESGSQKKSATMVSTTGRERLLLLAQPKEPKTEWYTSVGPHLRWGTQEMIWPIKKETLSAGSTERLDQLALPKVDFTTGDHVNRPHFFYSCGRSSVIWNVGEKAKAATCADRVKILAGPKHREFNDDKPQFKYSCGRSSPIVQVDRNALSSEERPLTRVLARHKTFHHDFKPEKPIHTVISPTALKAMASERIQHLSTPKPRNEGPFRYPEWDVSKSAKNASATPRCLELARPKQPVDGYQLPREEQWPVTRAAKRANTTGRIEELSKPIVRATMDHVQFNPDAFLVKPWALKGSFPPRIEQLSRPIER